MTKEEMANYLGVTEHLEALRQAEINGRLPGSYLTVSDYLGSLVLRKQNKRWAELNNRLNEKLGNHRDFKEVECFHDAFEKLIETLP